MKPVIEIIGGMRPAIYLTLHSFAFNGSILDLSSSIDRKFAELSEKKILENTIFIFSMVLGPKTKKKVALSEVSKTQSCLVFLDFLPDIVKKSIVQYFY